MILDTTVYKWISIEDALPPIDKNVIITDEKLVSMGSIFIDGKKLILWKSFFPYIHNPKYWMPLPEIKSADF